MPKFLISVSLILIVISSSWASWIEEYRLQSLSSPSGARECGMGESGVGLANYENAAFFNPAGLGIVNKRWTHGAVATSYEPMYPAFQLPDLWEYHLGGVMQFANARLGGLGVDWDYVSMGENWQYDVLGRPRANIQCYESTVSLSYGLDFLDTEKHYLGITAKYLRSVLAPGIGPHDEGGGRGFAFDAGYLMRLPQGFSFGFTMANMGPLVYYVDKDAADPLPYTWKLGLGYAFQSDSGTPPTIALNAGFDINRELVKYRGTKPPDPFWKAIYTGIFEIEGYDTLTQQQRKEARRDNTRSQLQQIQFNTGVELCLRDHYSFRSGLLIGSSRGAYEWHWGLGLRAFNHFQGDVGYIYAPEGFMEGFSHIFSPSETGATGFRHGQWQLTVTAYNLTSWDRGQFHW